MITRTETKTKSQIETANVTALLKARRPLIWITSREEARVERCLRSAAGAAKFKMQTWDFADGLGKQETRDPADLFEKIVNAASDDGEDVGRNIWVLRDLPPMLSNTSAAGMLTLRQLRNVVRDLPIAAPERSQAIVVLSTGGDVPPELSNHATVIEWPLPDRAEIGEALDEVINAQEDRCEPLNGKRDAAIEAAVGLTEEEALACISRSIVQFKRVDPAAVAKEKQRVIAREKLLTWHDPLPEGLSGVGGLENIKRWLATRAAAFTKSARAYGLPLPKGMLLVGVPGTGKSLVCKAVGTAFGRPLIRLDLGALKSKFVGDSEGNIRRVIKVIEAIGECIVWIDEIEKALQGATSGSSDGGTSSDQLGTLLSWMQEQTSGAFVVATANDVSVLPPELLRKGRFDELFFVDVPTKSERAQIVATALRSFKRDADLIDRKAVAIVTENFTGAEIAAMIPEAMFTAFNDGGREIQTADVIAAAKATVPLFETAADKIKALRAWGNKNARAASEPEESTTEKRTAARLDI